jgi:hypothetical protein
MQPLVRGLSNYWMAESKINIIHNMVVVAILQMATPQPNTSDNLMKNPTKGNKLMLSLNLPLLLTQTINKI